MNIYIMYSSKTLFTIKKIPKSYYITKRSYSYSKIDPSIYFDCDGGGGNGPNNHYFLLISLMTVFIIYRKQ